MMDDATPDVAAAFPCTIDLEIPFPDSRLAGTALKAIEVDPELSPLVKRQLSLAQAAPPTSGNDNDAEGGQVLKVEYRATTNRMLRVAVNSFMDSLKLVLDVMEQLDVDVLADADKSIDNS